MGGWGYEPFENDGDLDWRGDFNDDLGLRKALKKEIKQVKYPDVSRAAIEYLIRMDDAGLITIYGDDELIDLAIKRAKEIKIKFADPKDYMRDDDDPENDTIQQSIRGHVKSIDRQLDYLNDLKSKMKREKPDEGVTLSKAELQEAFDRLKKKTGKGKKKATKKKGPIADRKERISGRQELADAYAKLKEEES